MAVIVGASVYFRHRGSAESKPVAEPHTPPELNGCQVGCQKAPISGPAWSSWVVLTSTRLTVYDLNGVH